MSHFDLIRQQARDFRREVCGAKFAELFSAADLLAMTAQHTAIKCCGLAKGDGLLYGALAVFDEGIIYFDKTLPPNYALFCQAHEFAHFRLHEISTHCTPAEINFAVVESAGFSAESRVLGYGQSAKTEREANAFAAEFLLPCGLAQKALVTEKLTASQIAAKVGLPVNLVYSQLAQSLIQAPISPESKVQSPRSSVQSPKSNVQSPKSNVQSPKSNVQSQIESENPKSQIPNPKSEDQTQIIAAQTEICPTLLEAAPGTGKTRTLIERICFLVREKEVAPESILALTFSNKAAEEMRERIAEAIDKETATRLEMTTFHAFGLNLLRKYYNAAKLPDNAPIIDRIAAVSLLEEKLLSLKLKHFQNLREPLENLPAILGTISRAKDELVTVADFQALAEAQRQKAETAAEIETAEKCLETARVYRIYDEITAQRGLLDYGDLIFRAVRLLRENEAVREQINEEFRHVLVDEYQDVNRAGAELLRLISNNGRGLWAVGDARQAIYRWRGAATTRNVRDFANDFPAPQNLFLGKNYRSRPHIVAAVSTFANEINESGESAGFTDWVAHRSAETGEIRFAVAENLGEETAWIAEQMRGLQAGGTAWREQAVIARTHKILQRIAEHLEKQGIPILYLGNWLESGVARDVLSWLALVGGDKYALVRVANFPAYQISFAAVQRVISEAIENKTSIIETIKILLRKTEFDVTTQKSFARLQTDFSVMPSDASMWKMAASFLFENGAYLTDFTTNLKASEKSALFQLLQLAQSFDAKNTTQNLSRETAIDEFLRYVRRLKMFGEEQALQQLPGSAAATDAVRLLTIHAAKGLEFEAVFVPHLGARYYPQAGKTSVSALPHGVTDLDEKAEHAQEEKSLFFVAISRARQVLCLSRAVRYGKQPSNASPFLKSLAAHLRFSPESGVSWQSSEWQPEIIAEIQFNSAQNYQKPEFLLHDLENYEKCPRRYFYQTRLKKEKSATAIYREFHRALYESLNFCVAEKIAEREVSFAKLAEFFRANQNLAEHANAEIYTAEGLKILNTAHEKIAGENPENLSKKLCRLDLPNAEVIFAPDYFRVERDENGAEKTVAHIWRSGKLRQKEGDEFIYQLLHENAKQAARELEINVVSLKTGEEISVPRKLKRGQEIPPAEKFAALVNAADGILQQNFSPKPGADCVSCRFYFICSN